MRLFEYNLGKILHAVPLGKPIQKGIRRIHVKERALDASVQVERVVQGILWVHKKELLSIVNLQMTN